MFDILNHFTMLQIGTLMISAILIGINKTAIPGIGVLPVVLLTMAFEGRLSTGLQLIMLAMADLIAVAYYRRNADWKIVLRLLPWAWAGLAIGSFILHVIPEDNDRIMRMIIGGIVLVRALLNYIRSRLPQEKIPTGLAVSAGCGTLLGVTTQIANAAGPVAALYFLAMRLPKAVYMGCSAWFFLIINWTKLPIFIWEGRITLQAFRIDLLMIPFLFIGGALGVFLLAKMPQKLFENIIQILVVITAIKLFF